ncbi:MAG: electron transport complex subunit RsxC [bacterium]|nr:electron transport complex subunit RsxC [bacterium]
MKRLSFTGGVYPVKRKELVKHKEIEELPVPKKVVIPLNQHIGAPCDPKVEVNDQVKIGQVVGDTDKFVSSPVHASISGKVISIKDMPHPVLGKCLAIIIEGDGKSEWVEKKPLKDWTAESPNVLRNRIREAGIVGLGGAAFPTHVKLSPPKDKPIDTVILNGAECEPYLTCDYRIMLEDTGSVITGLKIIMKILGARHAYIGIEDDKIDAIRKVKGMIDDGNIKVIALKAKYPQGAEKQLIKTILNREVPSLGLPFDVGVLVQNVGTSASITRAIMDGEPLISRVITVTGKGVTKPKNLRVRIGTLFSDVISFCGGLTREPGKIIMGGPMMGLAQFTTNIPVIKGTSGIIVFERDEVEILKETPCIKCGKCVDVCPMRLLPSVLGTLSANGRFKEAENYGVLDCIECGCCSFVCPAKRHLIQYIKLAKAEITAMKKAAS